MKTKYSKIKPGEKVDFLMDYQFLSNANPGPGNYCPYPILPKIKENRTQPKDWIEKHKNLNKK